jgi:hypothetical protein
LVDSRVVTGAVSYMVFDTCSFLMISPNDLQRPLGSTPATMSQPV